MGTDDKIRNKAEDLVGKVKEAAGAVSGNEDQEAEGRMDQTKADFKDAGEQVKDAGGKVKDAFKN